MFYLANNISRTGREGYASKRIVKEALLMLGFPDNAV